MRHIACCIALIAGLSACVSPANACAWGDYDCAARDAMRSMERENYVPPYDYGAVNRQIEVDRRVRDLERDNYNQRIWESTHPNGPLPLTCPLC
jgi:hypothetical protein